MHSNTSTLAVARLPELKQSSVVEILVGSVLVLSMTQGAWVAAGVSESVLKAMLEVGFIALFVIGVTQRLSSGQRLRGIGIILPFGLVVPIGLISGWAHGTSFIESVFYVRLIVLPTLLLLGLLNVSLDRAASRRLLFLIVGLILLQLPFFVYKWLVIGVEEKHWIGALSQTAGQLGLIFPLLVLSILVPRYLAAGGWLILIIMAYSLLPVVNEKRAILVMLPMLLMAATITHLRLPVPRTRKEGSKPKICVTRLLLLFMVCLTVWISSVKSIPSLRCEPGSPCVTQVITYMYDYLVRDYLSPMNISKTPKEQNTNIQLGRLTMIKESARILADKGWKTLFFGIGGGAINPSPNLGPDRADIMFKKFGLRGTYSFGLMLLWEGGVSSVIAAAGFFVFFWLALVRRLAVVQTNRSIVFGNITILMVAVLAFDFFGYSTAGWVTHCVTPFVFTLSAIFIRHGYPAKAE
ncbi:hypothetical protein [Rhizobium etli]|uniref:hypothetical protein n=1 Tax=Rhizobium etli TaxID=29449 RepID=UPI0003839E7F|nr:hypothetical protein [Rhizobium etli]AGS20635.1 hypothetical protein REMIM1_CH00785 [Rhizobium etli bv. mimosae str. Mim1]